MITRASMTRELVPGLHKTAGLAARSQKPTTPPKLAPKRSRIKRIRR